MRTTLPVNGIVGTGRVEQVVDDVVSLGEAGQSAVGAQRRDAAERLQRPALGQRAAAAEPRPHQRQRQAASPVAT